MPAPPDPQRVAAALALLDEGASPSEAADAAGCTLATLRKHAKRLRGDDWWAERVRHGTPIDHEAVDRALNLIADGSTLRDAAAAAGLSELTVRRYGVRLRGRDWWDEHVLADRRVDPAALDRAVEQVADGASAADAADAAGIGVATLRRHAVARHGRDWWDARVSPGTTPDPDAVRRGLEIIADGATLTDAADAVGVQPRTLRRHGIERHGEDWWRAHVTDRDRTPAAELEAALDRLADGRSASEVAADLGVGRATLRARAVAARGQGWWDANVTRRGSGADADAGGDVA